MAAAVKDTSNLGVTLDANKLSVRRLALTAIGVAKTEEPGPLIKEEEIRPAIKGVVTVHIKEAKKFYSGDFGTFTNAYVRLSIRNLVKRTRISPIVYGQASWDQIKHLPVTVLRNRKHPFNLLALHVFTFDSQNTMVHHEIGYVAFHLHDVMKSSPVSGAFDVWDRHHIVGEIHLDICFTYGFFGYGYSLQLKDEMPVESHLQHSLFPRVDPPEERQESHRLTITPKAVPHPHWVPFDTQVVLGYGTNIADLVRSEIRDMDEFALLKSKMTRLEGLRRQYNQLSARHHKIAFLRKIILSSNQKLEAVKDESEFDGKQHLPMPYFKFLRPTVTLSGLVPTSGAKSPSLQANSVAAANPPRPRKSIFHPMSIAHTLAGKKRSSVPVCPPPPAAPAPIEAPIPKSKSQVMGRPHLSVSFKRKGVRAGSDANSDSLAV